MLDRLYNSRIPEYWVKYSWRSTTLGFWFNELLERDLQYKNWLNSKPKVFWLNGLFNPQGFLTAMKQEARRERAAKEVWPLDKINIYNTVLKINKEDVKDSANVSKINFYKINYVKLFLNRKEGVYVYGLYLEGAGWDKRNSYIVESTHRALFVQMPIIHIFAINEPPIINDKIYACPIYKKPSRTDLLYITSLY